jgi:hypothetical protein
MWKPSAGTHFHYTPRSHKIANSPTLIEAFLFYQAVKESGAEGVSGACSVNNGTLNASM